MLKFLVSFTLFFTSCASLNDVNYGVQKGQLASLPARIAVLNCQAWPNTARFKNQPISNVAIDAQEKLCRKFDRAVIRGFSGQPFMRGYSPKIVMRLLKKSKAQSLTAQLPGLWQAKNPCTKCDNVISKYKVDVANSPDWRMWLQNFSDATRNTDATLLPFINFVSEHHVNDRGLEKAIRQAAVSLLLIDNGNGNLIWSNLRKSDVENQTFFNEAKFPSLKFPNWEELYKRLFTNDMWNEFPGRQN